MRESRQSPMKKNFKMKCGFLSGILEQEKDGWWKLRNKV
jgi:hypothetical protein